MAVAKQRDKKPKKSKEERKPEQPKLTAKPESEDKPLLGPAYKKTKSEPSRPLGKPEHKGKK